tara:strand:+ start:3220 stop:3711 length:492 start_codon:yes stop_codon:yes gene_type:complete
MNIELTQQPWTSAFVEIDKHIKEPSTKSCIKSIVKFAYRKHQIEVKDLYTRKRNVVDINIILVTIISEQFRNLPLRVIGGIFKKHHATVIHYKKNYENVLCGIPAYLLLHRELTDICVYEKYGILQSITGKTPSELKAECLRLMGINRELESKLTTIKELVHA